MIRETENRRLAMNGLSEELGFEVKPSQVFDFGVKHMTDRDILTAAHTQPTTINFIESNEGKVNWQRVIENGLSIEVDRIKKAQDFKRYQESFKQTQVTNRPTPVKHLIKQALEVEGEVSTWSELVRYLESKGHTVNYKSPNDLNVVQPYYYQNKWLLAQTEGRFQVYSNGRIKYSA